MFFLHIFVTDNLIIAGHLSKASIELHKTISFEIFLGDWKLSNTKSVTQKVSECDDSIFHVVARLNL
jgi:hypothetical protein